MAYRCAKDQRVPAASVCPFSLWGVFCLLDLVFFLFLLLGTPFLLPLVGWRWGSAILIPESTHGGKAPASCRAEMQLVQLAYSLSQLCGIPTTSSS